MKTPPILEIRLQNLLSFGPDCDSLQLKPLNVLIGPNGAGKSNLIEAIGLLRAAPKNLSAPVKETGGVRDWLWKGSKNPTATIDAVLDNPKKPEMPIRHTISFVEHGERFEVTSEIIENRDPYPHHDRPYFYYKNEAGHPRLTEQNWERPREGEEEDNDRERPLPRETINPEESILSQVKDPERYPVLNHLSDIYARIRLYREWTFGRYTPPRQSQKADLSSTYLSESCDNLALVLNEIRTTEKANDLVEALSALYREVKGFEVKIKEGWVQLLLGEEGFYIPATRLSDGTLRYLCLLAILCHPDPPPLVCIEEPELGLHPDILPTLANLLIKASQRCQLIVTTHSDLLVDQLTETPESVIVCEKYDGSTVMSRLNETNLKVWLKKYSLGELWISGEIGGKRW